MALPRISVITPSFNQGEFIRQTIDSVLEQDYPNFEHIVVDGGSTDQTLDILSSYPHLSWTSEPDNGQSHALNRGFARASGDIIAWINSDDYYAPGAFSAVAARLEAYPVVMGMCQMTDREGRPTELIRNVEHTWFDILTYWVYDSIPTQPSIFFARSLLEAVRRDDGNYLDPDLHFVMDFDLWLRMARRYPFNNRIDGVLSAYRMYESNKTGGDWDLIFKEASRVFARHANDGDERRVAFLVPLATDAGSTIASLDGLSAQSLRDFEVLLVTSAPGSHRGTVDELARRYKRLSLRHVAVDGEGVASALNAGLHSARATILCTIPVGTQISPDLGLSLVNVFADDSVGALTSTGADVSPVSARTATNAPTATIKGLVSAASRAGQLAIRKVALAELGGVATGANETYALAELYLRLIHKGWQVGVESAWREGEGGTGLDGVAASLISNLDEEYDAEPFAKVRADHGAAIRFPDELVRSARSLLGQSP